MMQYTAILLAAGLLLVGHSFAAPYEAKQASGELKDFTFDEIIPNQFGLRGFNGTWLSGEELLYRQGGDYVKLNVNTGDSVVVVTTDALVGGR